MSERCFKFNARGVFQEGIIYHTPFNTFFSFEVAVVNERQAQKHRLSKTRSYRPSQISVHAVLSNFTKISPLLS